MGLLGKGLNILSGGLIGSGPATDLLMGKQTGPQFNPYQERPMTGEEKELQKIAYENQIKGLQALQTNKFTPEEEAKINADYNKAQVSQQLTNLRTGIEDSRRQLQKQIAQRGLQNTSIGLGQITGQERDLATAQAQVKNQYANQDIITPLEAEKIRRQRALDLTNISRGSQIRSEYDTGAPSSRQGGIAPILGTGLGAFLGAKSGNAAGGAQAGYGIGQSFTQLR